MEMTNKMRPNCGHTFHHPAGLSPAAPDKLKMLWFC